MARSKALETDEVGSTTIGPNIQVDGRISGEEDLRIEGRVDGAISLTETLYVDANGVVVATVEARDVVVSGILLGDVTATNSVHLAAGAKLVGNITTPRLIIADGAAFRGDVQMTGVPAMERSKSAKAARNFSAPAQLRRSSGSSVRTTSPDRPAASRSTSSSRASDSREEDEVTVVVKHSNLRKGEKADAPKKRSKKVPARGKRRVNRR